MRCQSAPGSSAARGAALMKYSGARLLDLKFFEFSEDISAAWIWTRVKRVGTSRRSIFQEELGYIEGGSETLVTALSTSLEQLGGRIHLATPVRRVETAKGRVTAVCAGDHVFPADAVISTVPAPMVPELAPDLPEDTKAAYRAIRNIGVVCVMLSLRQKVSRHFWVNIVDPANRYPRVYRIFQPQARWCEYRLRTILYADHTRKMGMDE